MSSTSLSYENLCIAEACRFAENVAGSTSDSYVAFGLECDAGAAAASFRNLLLLRFHIVLLSALLV